MSSGSESFSKSVVWETIAAHELSGRVKKTLPSGDVFIESDTPIVHPELPRPVMEVYAGVPGVRFPDGSSVAFNLNSQWRPMERKKTPRAHSTSVRPIDELERVTLRDQASLELLREAVGVEDRIEVVALRESELDGRAALLDEQMLRARSDALAIEEAARRAAEEIVENASRSTAALEAELLVERQRLVAEKSALEADRAEFLAEGGMRFLEAIRYEDEFASSSPIAADSLPSDLIAVIEGAAETSGLQLPSGIARRATIGQLVAAALGQLLVFAGPPGSGKTSLATWLPHLLGMRVSVIPVRPGWLDAVDLLGYLDPRDDRFIPAPFLDLLIEARRDTASGRHHVVVLDEMNIARIENYGADLLSQLEKAHSGEGGGQLDLYSSTIRREADRSLASAISEGASKEQLAPLIARVQRLSRIPPRMEIPTNFVVAGTLNNDETTNELSPKVLDRSLSIRVPVTAPDLGRGLVGSPTELCVVTDESLRRLHRVSDQQLSDARALWSVATDVVGGSTVPSLHLSHRCAQATMLAPGLADLLHLSPLQVMDEILVMKVLPWIRYFPARDRGATTELSSVSERARSAGLLACSDEIDALLDSSDDLVQYLR